MTTLSDNTVTLRKQCRCYGCNRLFLSGEKIRKITTVTDDGDLSRTAWCATCDEYWFEHMNSDDEIMEGELKTEDPEGWEEIRQKVEAAK